MGVVANVLTLLFFVAISWSALRAAAGDFGAWLVTTVDAPEVQILLTNTLSALITATAAAVGYWATTLYSGLLDSMRRRREHNERVMAAIAHLTMEGTVQGVLLRQIAKGADATAMAESFAELRRMVRESNFEPHVRDNFLELVSRYADVVSTDDEEDTR